MSKVKGLIPFGAAFAGAVMSASVALADGPKENNDANLLGSYRTTLSEVDTKNSRGATIEGLCAYGQQDRANVHRFDKADPGDEVDKIFTTLEARNVFAEKCSLDGDQAAIDALKDSIVNGGDGGQVDVSVYASQSGAIGKVVMSPVVGNTDAKIEEVDAFVLAQYTTTIGDADTKNSRGAPLEGLCALGQQDRANVYRFDKADPGDEKDGIFTTLEARKEFFAKCFVEGDKSDISALETAIEQGKDPRIQVTVFGSDKKAIDRIVITPEGP